MYHLIQLTVFLNSLIFSVQLRQLMMPSTADDNIISSNLPSMENTIQSTNTAGYSEYHAPTETLKTQKHVSKNVYLNSQGSDINLNNASSTHGSKFVNSIAQNKTQSLRPGYTQQTGYDNPSDEFIGPDGKLQITICDHPNGFLRRQKKLCYQYLHLMESVVRGYFMGLRECEYQFSSHRWNCQGHNITVQTSSVGRQKRLKYRQSGMNKENERLHIKTYLDKLLSKGTRESAYVLAVTSAGVSHAVTKACSSGSHDNCGCDRTIYDHPREPNFEWSGCSDNIHFGAAFSRQFLDVRERGRLKRNPKLGLTNLHNNHVGRQMVINKMEVQCKCHGVSGSCEMRTCWRSLPKFRNLGAHLQERFQKAVQVEYFEKHLVPMQAVDELRKEANGNILLNGEGLNSLPSPTENDLIYIRQSPTFCHHDPHYGSIGTYGRQCDEASQGLNSCHYLCCGRGFKRQTYVQEERCECKFQWCCKVLCKTCRKTVVVSTCN